MGGVRAIGTDQDGNAPEYESNGWSGSLTFAKTFPHMARRATAAHGTDESIEGNSTLTDDMFKRLVGMGSFGFVGVTPFTFNDKLYMENGAMMAYGMFPGFQLPVVGKK